MAYYSTKKYGHNIGLSAVFRQPKAHSHCKYLHGYSLAFKFTFGDSELDEKNWVVDFGRAKRSEVLIDGMNLKDWLNYMLDHTVIISEDDPSLEEFKQLDSKGGYYMIKEIKQTTPLEYFFIFFGLFTFLFSVFYYN